MQADLLSDLRIKVRKTEVTDIWFLSKEKAEADQKQLFCGKIHRKTPILQNIFRWLNLFVASSWVFFDEIQKPPTEVFLKEAFLEISQNSQENTSAGVCFIIKLQPLGSGTGIVLLILQNF